MSGKRCSVGARLATKQTQADYDVRNLARKLARASDRSALLDMLSDAKDVRVHANSESARHVAECAQCGAA